MPIGKDTLGAFVNPIFVETGTYRGAGIALAKSTGFKRIYSVDIDAGRVAEVRKKYVEDPSVSVEVSDSPEFLRRLVPILDQPTTFWLDAHPPGYNLNRDNCPLWDEIDIVSRCKVRHVILIDDFVCFNGDILDDLIRTIRIRNLGMYVCRVQGHPQRHADILAVFPGTMPRFTIPVYTLYGAPLVIDTQLRYIL